jgi:predicted HAD superfamily Cof-like phosphohydrolase
MSSDWFSDVLEFHQAMCPEQVADRPTLATRSIANFRADLIDEETAETFDAIDTGDLPEIADGLADLIYVALGTAIAYGIDLRPVWDEVQRSNMAKVGGEVRADGKRLKPPGWTPPDIMGVLAKQGPLTGGGA